MTQELDRVKGGLLRIIMGVVGRTDFHALYPSKVVTQNTDGTLELQPDSAKLKPISKVPIRLGLPGVTVKVAAGARVLLGFEQGDPSRPRALLWEADSMTELVITAATKVTVNAPDVRLGDGTGTVVRYGDSITVTGTAPGALAILPMPLGSSKVKA